MRKTCYIDIYGRDSQIVRRKGSLNEIINCHNLQSRNLSSFMAFALYTVSKMSRDIWKHYSLYRVSQHTRKIRYLTLTSTATCSVYGLQGFNQRSMSPKSAKFISHWQNLSGDLLPAFCNDVTVREHDLIELTCNLSETKLKDSYTYK